MSQPVSRTQALVREALAGSVWLRERMFGGGSLDFSLGRPNVGVLETKHVRGVVKFAMDARPIKNEAVVYGEVCRSLADAADVSVPGLIHVDDHILVTEMVELDERPVFDESFALSASAALARALARVHSAGASLRPFVPAVVSLFGRRSEGSGGNLRQRQLAADVRADVATRRCIATVEDAWRNDGFVHGDLRRTNVIGLQGGRRMWLIDWETAGVGDRRWDLACLWGEMILLAHASCVGDGSQARHVAESSLNVLLSSYDDASRVGSADLEVLSSYASAWLLQQAWESLTQVGEWTPQAQTRLSIGRILAGSRW